MHGKNRMEGICRKADTMNRHGESDPNARLSLADVQEIRANRATTTARQEAEKHGVSLSLIHAIRRQARWNDLQAGAVGLAVTAILFAVTFGMIH